MKIILYRGGKGLSGSLLTFEDIDYIYGGTLNITDKTNEELFNFIIETGKNNNPIYQKRGAKCDELRLFQQNYHGKLGECIAGRYYFLEENEKITDMEKEEIKKEILEIYPKNQIKFLPDIVSKNKKYRYSVKTQDNSSLKYYGAGRWTFQKEDFKRMFKNKNLYTHIVGVLINNDIKKINKLEDIKLSKMQYKIVICEPVNIIYNSFIQNKNNKYEYNEETSVFVDPEERFKGSKFILSYLKLKEVKTKYNI
jgi:hypothetical protein